jgi:hypothetical protein
MYKSQPEVNRLLADKWHDYTRRIHLDRLRRMKPDIDNREPPKQVHLRQNLKRAQQLLERSSQIERDNRKLLLKMSAIMQRSALDNKNEVEFKSLNRNKLRGFGGPFLGLACFFSSFLCEREFKKKKKKKKKKKNPFRDLSFFFFFFFFFFRDTLFVPRPQFLCVCVCV